MIKKLLSFLVVFAMALPMMAGVASNGSGTKANPYTVAGMVAQNNNKAKAWVKAYLVGQLNGTIDKPEFEAPFTIAEGSTQGTNIIIAATADERTTFYPVQLPKGAVRDALNLPENPDLVGAEVMLYGSLEKYFSTNGMKSVTCAIVNGVVYGTEPAEDPTTPDTPDTPETPETPETPDTPDTPAVGEGNGTKANPYNVAAAIAMNNSGANAWVEAYIVGQSNGKSISDTQYEAPFTVASGSTQGTNIIVADAADETTTIFPVQLPKGAVRDALSLPDHPELDGKKVLLYGSLEKYFGINGMKSVTCAIVDGVVYGTEPAEDPTTPDTPDTPDTPTEPEGNYFFSETFESSIASFAIDNKVMPEALTYVWTHDSNYKCAKATAYKSGKYEAESWLISPAFQIQGDATLRFEHASNYLVDGPTEATLYYTTNDGASWTKLDIPAYPTGWTFVSSGDITIPATTANVKIAFVYKSTTDNACTWEIKNVKVAGSTSIVDVVFGNEVNVYAQGGALYVEGAADAMVNIYSVAGVLVKQVAASQANGIVLPRGLYLVQVNNTVAKVIL